MSPERPCRNQQSVQLIAHRGRTQAKLNRILMPSKMEGQIDNLGRRLLGVGIEWHELPMEVSEPLIPEQSPGLVQNLLCNVVAACQL